MPAFIPGLELSHCFYHEAVRPILDAHFPGLPHAAARIGTGSDVLGFDTEMSTDHGWGPTVHLFLRDADAGRAGAVHETLRRRLPHVFLGYPVNADPIPGDPGSDVMRLTTDGPVNPRVYTTTVRAFVLEYLAYDSDAPLEAADWLSFSSQKLREVTAGAVHHDGVGELTEIRARLAYYPHDVWLYLLAAGWARIGQENHLMSRAGQAGDELGSALIGSRLVRDVMSLGFLMERQYAPYPKWFGTAFGRLACAAALTPLLWRAQQAPTWPEREAALGAACEHLARLHNALGLTPPLPETLAPFHSRPFQVIQSDAFVDALLARITDPAVQRVAARRPIGSLDQLSDSTDLRSDAAWRPILRQLYTE
jgi:hypothetical protein